MEMMKQFVVHSAMLVLFKQIGNHV